MSITEKYQKPLLMLLTVLTTVFPIACWGILADWALPSFDTKSVILGICAIISLVSATILMLWLTSLSNEY